MGVLTSNESPGGQVEVGFRDGFGVFPFNLPVHDLISQSVNQPGLAFGPVPGAFHGLVGKDLSRGLGMLAAEDACFGPGKIGQGESFGGVSAILILPTKLGSSYFFSTGERSIVAN
jgi:hypothetical protein